MARFTKEQRQQIVREFAIRHNGTYNPGLFLEEVREKCEEHPAHGWFEWDSGKAAHNWQLEQAREFARDLRVIFKVEEVGRNKAVRVREAPMPMVISPMDSRRDGGGYILVEQDDPSHMVEHCRQAAATLRQWVNRYQAALLHAGGNPASFDTAIGFLERASAPQIAAE